MDRLKQQFQFILEADQEKMITRQTFVSDASKKENDAEHAWHLALMTILLAEYANEPIDVLKTVTMVLIHDLVEIDAGDTYAYDSLGQSSKTERELLAAERIFQLLPQDQAKWLRLLWDEFEACQTPEAKFAHTMDNIQPIMLNAATHGQLWQENGISLPQILKRNEKTQEGSLVLWNYAQEHFIMPHVFNGKIKKNKES